MRRLPTRQQHQIASAGDTAQAARFAMVPNRDRQAVRLARQVERGTHKPIQYLERF
jgi:hypothetical protein